MRKILLINFIMIMSAIIFTSCTKQEEDYSAYQNQEIELNAESTIDTEPEDRNSVMMESKQKEQKEPKKEEVNLSISEFESVSKEVFQIREDDIVVGDENAPVKIYEYSSLTCPSCAYYNRAVFPELMNKFIEKGDVAYVIREFPFDRKALEAAILARCAGKEKYLSFKGILYGLQKMPNYSVV